MLLALKHNPALAAAGMAVETAEADLARARARFLPTVNFNETYNFSDNPSQVFMSKLNQRVFTGQDFLLNNLNNPNAYGNFRTGLVMRQPLFQAGEAALGYKQARLGREMAAAYVLSARQQLLFQVTQAYFGLQLAQENLTVVQQARRTAAEHLKIAQTRFQAGTVVNSDVLSAQVHLAKLTQEEMTAASQVQIARSALATVIGLPEAGERPLAPAPKGPAPLPPRLDDLKQTAQEKRPDLKQLDPGGPGGPAGVCQGPPQLPAPAARGGGVRRGPAAPLRVQRRQLHGDGPAQLQPVQRPHRPGQGEGDPGQRDPGPGPETGPGGPGPAPGDRGHPQPEDGPRAPWAWPRRPWPRPGRA